VDALPVDAGDAELLLARPEVYASEVRASRITAHPVARVLLAGGPALAERGVERVAGHHAISVATACAIGVAGPRHVAIGYVFAAGGVSTAHPPGVGAHLPSHAPTGVTAVRHLGHLTLWTRGRGSSTGHGPPVGVALAVFFVTDAVAVGVITWPRIPTLGPGDAAVGVAPVNGHHDLIFRAGSLNPLTDHLDPVGVADVVPRVADAVTVGVRAGLGGTTGVPGDAAVIAAVSNHRDRVWAAARGRLGAREGLVIGVASGIFGVADPVSVDVVAGRLDHTIRPPDAGVSEASVHDHGHGVIWTQWLGPQTRQGLAVGVTDQIVNIADQVAVGVGAGQLRVAGIHGHAAVGIGGLRCHRAVEILPGSTPV
jgi:hypothetical protein